MRWPWRDFEEIEQRRRHKEELSVLRHLLNQREKWVQTIDSRWQQVALGGLKMAEVIEENRGDCRTQMTRDGV
jgi:hypothetical protein